MFFFIPETKRLSYNEVGSPLLCFFAKLLTVAQMDRVLSKKVSVRHFQKEVKFYRIELEGKQVDEEFKEALPKTTEIERVPTLVQGRQSFPSYPAYKR